MAVKSRPLIDRFMDKVSPEPNSGCWLWTAALSTGGYAKIGITRSVSDAGHRVSYQLFCGEIPEGKIVRHKCDMPSCVNPDHLAVGTMADNSRDMVERRRAAFGSEQKRNTKLTVEQARRAKFSGERPYALAREFGCSPITIGDIQRGKRWRWLEV